MTSCLVLETPGRWRAASLVAFVALLVLPNIPLLAYGLQGGGADVASFGAALATSISIAFWTAGISFAIALPAGVATALYDYPLRSLLLALALLPSLMPSFLLAIGWQYLLPHAVGVVPCAVVFSSALTPLVLLASYVAARSLPRSLIDASRLAAGDRAVVRCALRHAAPTAMFAAAFAGVMTLSDPGPGQVFGVRTAASELLIGFAAHHDLALTARQCLILSAVALIASAPVIWFAAPRLSSALSARSRPAGPPRRDAGWAWVSSMPLAAMAAGLVAPLIGLVAPLGRGPAVWIVDEQHPGLGALWAVAETMRTVADTVLYCFGAAAVSVLLAVAWALAVGRERRLLLVSTAALLPLLALPPAGAALGLARLAALAPAWMDYVVRGRLFVCIALGLRLAPIAVLVVLRARQSLPRSWTLAAALHGIALPRFLARVLLPGLLPATLGAALLVALLAGADVSTMLLLHPPGHPSLPLAIFTVMANAPEQMVALLCLLYAGLAAVALAGMWQFASRVRRA